jgi:LacI family transcriptional regulator
MLAENPLKVALVLHTYMEENIGILRGIAEYERIHANWRFFLDDRAISAEDPNWILKDKWDGVICRHEKIDLLEECVKRGIPCVDLGNLPPKVPGDPRLRLPGVPKLQPDDRAIGHIGAEHLLKRGYTHFGFCGFSNDTWARERRMGFVEALELVNLKCDLFETKYPGLADPRWHAEEVQQIGRWLRNLAMIPHGIMACNDLRGHQVADAAMEFGIVIPDEIAIVGANNEAVRAELTHTPLSSVPVNVYDWGYRAAEALHKVMVGESVQEMTFIDPLPVARRRSTDAFAVEDSVLSKALSIIRKEACLAIRADDLARRVNVSRSLLEKKFRQYLRRTPSEEIRSVRIAAVKRMLLDTEKTLAEISEETGFEHPEYLSVMFKRMTGESPRDFRMRNCPGKRI